MEYQEWLQHAKTQPQNLLYDSIAKYSKELIIDSAFRSQALIAQDLGIHQSALSNILKLLKAQSTMNMKGSHGNDNTCQL